MEWYLVTKEPQLKSLNKLRSYGVCTRPGQRSTKKKQQFS